MLAQMSIGSLVQMTKNIIQMIHKQMRVLKKSRVQKLVTTVMKRRRSASRKSKVKKTLIMRRNKQTRKQSTRIGLRT